MPFVSSFNMGWRILVYFIRQPMLKLPTHSGFHDLFLKCLFIRFDSLPHVHSASEKLISYVSQTLIHIYVCENVAHNLCCQWKSQSHSPAHVRMRLHHRLIARLSTKRKKEAVLELKFVSNIPLFPF
jgi:hypothetical protein